jgi:FkbM family methyltransferase
MPGWIESFSLIDVGVSGGIPDYWQRIFGERLHALGVDPLVKEIQRLQNLENPPHIQYVDGFVTCKQCEIELLQNSLFSQTSAQFASELMQSSYAQEVFNSGQEMVFSDHRYTVDELVAASMISDPDFIKIDTDGHDFFVLHAWD